MASNTTGAQDRLIAGAEQEPSSDSIKNLIAIIEDLDTRLTKADRQVDSLKDELEQADKAIKELEAQ